MLEGVGVVGADVLEGGFGTGGTISMTDVVVDTGCASGNPTFFAPNFFTYATLNNHGDLPFCLSAYCSADINGAFFVPKNVRITERIRFAALARFQRAQFRPYSEHWACQVGREGCLFSVDSTKTRRFGANFIGSGLLDLKWREALHYGLVDDF